MRFHAIPLLLVGSLATTQEIVLVASMDNTIFEESASSNGAGSHMFVGRTGHDDRRRGLVRFDVSAAIPAGAVIDSAMVQMFMSKTSSGPKPVSLHRLVEAWGEGASNSDLEGGGGGIGAPAQEGEATWVDRFHLAVPWTEEGGDFLAAPSATVAVAGNDFYEWGPTAAMVADVQAWIDSPGLEHGWIVLGDESGPFTAKRFETRESFNPQFWPRLTVTFTVPSDCPEDLDGSGQVDGGDLGSLLALWGSGDRGADLDGDGAVGATDLQRILNAWGTCGS